MMAMELDDQGQLVDPVKVSSFPSLFVLARDSWPGGMQPFAMLVLHEHPLPCRCPGRQEACSQHLLGGGTATTMNPVRMPGLRHSRMQGYSHFR